MTDYFQLLGLKPEFGLNEAALHKAYIAMQQQFHPDRLIGKPEAERAKAIQLSMDATQGYETLKSPLTRAQHLLALNGVIVNSEGKDNVKASQPLLMEMMELREALSEADGQDLGELTAQLKTMMADCISQLQQAFEQEQYDNAGQLTIRLRYLGKALEEAYMRYHQQKAAQ